MKTLRLLLAILLMATGAQADVSLGFNLAPVRDWSTEQPFMNVFKTARRWIGHEKGRWGGMTFEDLERAGVLDENGWPMSIPDGIRSIGTLVLTDMPAEATALGGRYVLRYEGNGIIELRGRAENVRYGDNQVSFDFTPGHGTVEIRINRTDRYGTGDYLRNIELVREEYLAAFDAGAIFNPVWLEQIAGTATLRFMDWMETNHSTQGDWSARPRVDDFSYTREGVPIEVMLHLAETLGADPWFNMPHLADDTYVRNFAEMVHAGLARERKVHVEYSNEVWNFMFGQAEWAEAQAQARWGEEWKWFQFYGVRAAEIATIWADVFTGDARSRLVNVFAAHTGWQGLEQDALTGPLFVAEDSANPAPAEAFDAYAVTGYFGHGLGNDEGADMVRAWLAESERKAQARADAAGLEGKARTGFIREHRFDAAISTAIAELRSGVVSGNRQGSLEGLIGEIWPYHMRVAREFGLELVAYEAGPHVVGVGAQTDDAALAEFFTVLNYTEGMGQLMREMLAGWGHIGGGAFVIYSDIQNPTKWGSWGAQRFLGDSNPRWQAIAEYLERER